MEQWNGIESSVVKPPHFSLFGGSTLRWTPLYPSPRDRTGWTNWQID
jgi:hypothetical protein